MSERDVVIEAEGTFTFDIDLDSIFQIGNYSEQERLEAERDIEFLMRQYQCDREGAKLLWLFPEVHQQLRRLRGSDTMPVIK